MTARPSYQRLRDLVLAGSEREIFGPVLRGGGPDGLGKTHWDWQPGWCGGPAHKTLSYGEPPRKPAAPSLYWRLAPNGWWSELC